MLNKILPPAILSVLCLFPAAAPAADSFPLERVRLLDGPFKHAQDLNLDFLLQYDVDRLLAPFLKEAGLEPKGQSFPNWIGLDGHVAGHYLSAMAIYVAATGSPEAKRRMDYMLDELAACQAAHANGYVGGVPNGTRIWSEIAAGRIRASGFGLNDGWVPWYNLHKTFAGLYDAWRFAGSEQARRMLIELCDWCDRTVSALTDEQMQQMLASEHGGMNEVLADVYKMTGDKKYLDLARRFSHRTLLDPMSRRRDTLDNMHANTQVPKAVGFQRIAEHAGDSLFADAAEFFWQTVVDNRTVAFGGNSRREHFPAARAAMEMIEEREGPESCNTYNMLKLTEGLHRMNPQARYADYYERALFNHILSTQHPEHGGYVYFTPARPRHYRVYSAPNSAMWCCVGSGMENHGKYGAFIYSHNDDSLYVNLFIASQLDWREKGVAIRQETSFPDRPATALTVLTDAPVRFTLKIRHPQWVPAGRLTLTCNDRTWTPQSQPSSYVDVTRTWQNGDRLEIALPMHTTAEPMPHLPDYVALLHGPIVLAAKTGREDLRGLIAGEGRMDHVAHGPLLPLNDAPVLVGERDALPAKIQPVPNAALRFTAPDLIRSEEYRDLVLEPFYRIHDSRYIMYWRLTPPDAFAAVQAAASAREAAAISLDRRTVDRVIPGEQQPEVEHSFTSESSEAGVFRGASWRHARAPGWFAYRLRTAPDTPLQLRVRYWGNESGPRAFDILIDDKKLAAENITGKWNRDEFVDVSYPIPAEWIPADRLITVTFKPHPANIAGGIFDLRILTPEPKGTWSD